MFHVPELTRIIDHPLLGSDRSAGNNGAFDLDSPEPGWRLALICSDGSDPDTPEGDGWEHVSVHAYKLRAIIPPRRTHEVMTRTPTWKEMAFVKDLCWDAEDVVIQYHPRKSEYVNLHRDTLHLWRSRTQAIPTPPPILVGPLAQEIA